MIYNYLQADATLATSWVLETFMVSLQSPLHANIAHVAVKGWVPVPAEKQFV